MSINNIKDAMPEYAKDLKLNLSNLVMDETLNKQQKAGCFLACAIAGRNQFVIKNVMEQISEHIDEKTINAIKASAAIMGMNNIYYRFVHLSSNSDYQTMPAKLRMNVIGNPGVDKVDFELWSLAVSAVNGCGMCIDSHEKILRDHDITKEQIQTAVRIASVVFAISCVLNDDGIAL